MERISAAYAMDWSIDLEKGLRSKNHGRRIEAILLTGSRLEQWNKEPKYPMYVYNMFGLVQGEDRVFANSILLRIAEAFRLGDINTRRSVVKIFLPWGKNRNKRKSSKHAGILSKERVVNAVELLARVKRVYGSGDVESRALSLFLFGCWADFAKDNADIRYLILSSLASSHPLEVKASLFAAGCFCKLSGDFAAVVLEVLIELLTSSTVSSAEKLAGVRVLAKMTCPQSLATKAYKVGKKLLLNPPAEEFLVGLLISLSKLASRSILLIPQLVDLVVPHISQENTFCVRFAALRCIRYMLGRGVCHFPTSVLLIQTLSNILVDSNLSPAVHREALWVLHKVILYKLPCVPVKDMLELPKLLKDIKNSPLFATSNKLEAIRLLVDLSNTLRARNEIETSQEPSYELSSQVISLVMDQIASAMKEVPGSNKTDSGTEQECQNLLKLLLFLVEEQPDLGISALDNICLLIQNIANMDENRYSKKEKLMSYVYKFVVACFEVVNEAASYQVIHTAKLLFEHVHGCSFFDQYTHTIFSLLLHSYITWNCMEYVKKDTLKLDEIFGMPVLDYFVKHEILALENAKNMLKEKDFWSAYKAGKYAACQGAWAMAAFLFEQLVSKVRRNCFRDWLKFLSLHARSEMKIQLLVLHKAGPDIVSWLDACKISVGSWDDFGETAPQVKAKIGDLNLPVFDEEFAGACADLCSSERALEFTFYFKKWFLILRSKVIEAVMDEDKLLSGYRSVNEGKMDRDTSDKCNRQISSVLHSLDRLSFRFNRLAREFDLINTSFLGMDGRSSKMISALALGCSVLAFSAAHAFFILPASTKFSTCSHESSQILSHASIIQDWIGRLCRVDHVACKDLRLLLRACGNPKRDFHLLSRNQTLKIGWEARDILKLCNFAVSGVTFLQSEVNGMNHEEIIYEVIQKGLQLLGEIIEKWVVIPFRMPGHFFRIRPCVGSELFVFNSNSRKPESLSVPPGSVLSLNLCLQLKNMPPDLPVRPTKLHCVLYSKKLFRLQSSSGEESGKAPPGFQPQETGDVLEMSERLQRYVMERAKSAAGRCEKQPDNGGDGAVSKCASLELNGRGQGFSTCLFDVSGFPAGSYRIKWFSACIDSRGSYWTLLPLNAGPVFTVL